MTADDSAKSGLAKFGLRALTSLTVTCAFAGCSGSSGNGGGGASGAEDYKAGSKAEALARLPDESRTHFEAWKGQLIKSCMASDAFGIGSPGRVTDPGIDTTALLSQTGESVVIRDQNEAVFLTGVHSKPGVANSKAQRSVSVNGRLFQLSAEANRVGSHCVISLYGQVVYDTDIAESFVAGGYYGPGLSAESAAGGTQLRELNGKGLADVPSADLGSFIERLIGQPVKAKTILGEKLKLTPEQVDRYFQFGSGTNGLRVSYQLQGEGSDHWSGSRHLLGASERLKRIFSPSPAPFAIAVHVGPPLFEFDGAKNDGDAGSSEFKVEVQPRIESGRLIYRSARLTQLTSVAADASLTNACVRGRVLAYKGLTNASALKPEVSEVTQPCLGLDPNLDSEIERSGTLRALLPIVYQGVRASARFNHGGWDQVAVQLASRAVKDGRDVQAELDPDQIAPVITTLSRNTNVIKAELDETKNLESLKPALYEVGFRLALNGETVPESGLTEVVRAADMTVIPFEQSTREFIRFAGVDPVKSYEQMNFGLNIGQDYKDEALKALALAKDVDYAGFKQNVFDRVLQARPSLDALKLWSDRLGAIKTAIHPYMNLGSLKGRLVESSIDWLKTNQINQSDLPAIYSAFNNVASLLPESSVRLLTALNHSIPDNRSSLDFARTMGEEYKTLVASVGANAGRLGHSDWASNYLGSLLQNKPSVSEIRSLNETWAAAVGFRDREAERTKGDLSRSNDSRVDTFVMRAVEERWSSHDFRVFESLAALATYKPTCDYYKGLSSRANCAGEGLFSKKTGQFLDPAFNNRYEALGRDFGGYLSRLANEFAMKTELVHGFFGSFNPLWSSCAAIEFRQKSDLLKSDFNQWVTTSDFSEKFRLERSIRNDLEDCRSR